MDPTGPQLDCQAAEKAKMAQAEEAQRAEVARLMETLTPAQALPNQQLSAGDGMGLKKCMRNVRKTCIIRDYPNWLKVLHVLGEMQRLTLRAPDDARLRSKPRWPISMFSIGHG